MCARGAAKVGHKDDLGSACTLGQGVRRGRHRAYEPLSVAYLMVGNAATIRCGSWCERCTYFFHGRQRTYGGVGDLAISHGDIEVDADKDALALEVEVGDGEFV